MKATGIVRRIDDLGRVVIPKETRRALNILDGDPLEIYVDDGSVVLKKYDYVRPIKTMLVELRRCIAEEENLVSRDEMIEKLAELSALIEP